MHSYPYSVILEPKLPEVLHVVYRYLPTSSSKIVHKRIGF